MTILAALRAKARSAIDLVVAALFFYIGFIATGDGVLWARLFFWLCGTAFILFSKPAQDFAASLQVGLQLRVFAVTIGLAGLVTAIPASLTTPAFGIESKNSVVPFWVFWIVAIGNRIIRHDNTIPAGALGSQRFERLFNWGGLAVYLSVIAVFLTRFAIYYVNTVGGQALGLIAGVALFGGLVVLYAWYYERARAKTKEKH